jgi:hypothetical protein
MSSIDETHTDRKRYVSLLLVIGGKARFALIGRLLRAAVVGPLFGMALC